LNRRIHHARADPRNPENARHVRLLLVERPPVVQGAVLPHPLAVVGRDAKNGPVPQPLAREIGDKSPDETVHVGDLAVVSVDGRGAEIVPLVRHERVVRLEEMSPREERLRSVRAYEPRQRRIDERRILALRVGILPDSEAEAGALERVVLVLHEEEERGEEPPGRVPLGAEDLREGGRVVGAHPKDERGAIPGGHQPQDGEKAAGGRRVGVVKDDPLAGHPVDARRDGARIAVAAEVIRAERVHGDDDEIHPPRDPRQARFVLQDGHLRVQHPERRLSRESGRLVRGRPGEQAAEAKQLRGGGRGRLDCMQRAVPRPARPGDAREKDKDRRGAAQGRDGLFR